jgi:hypothetical protein
MEHIIKINKTELNKISFAEENVLDEKSKNDRANRLIVAIGRHKDGTGRVEITFQTANRGKFKVFCAILTAGKEYIEIKGGQTIPIKSIIKISL